MGSLPREGDVLSGKYVVDGIIGSGGMGVVLAATHLRLGTRVAVKVMSHAHDARHHARFMREAHAAARLRSEHVARVLDVDDVAPGVPFLVMELLAGADLGRVLEERGPFSIDEAVGYMLQACEGVAEAHAAGIVHRDLKPSNLFLTQRTDGSPLVKLLDFGVSKLVEGTSPELALTGKDARLGSPEYMAPEQRRAAADVDHRADIFSLGVILYEMLAGRPPFVAERGVSLTARMTNEEPPPLDGVPSALERVVRRCLAKGAGERFQSVAELGHALAPFTTEGEAAAARIERVLAAPRVELAKSTTPPDPPPSGPVTEELVPPVDDQSASVHRLAITPRRASWKLVAAALAAALLLALVSAWLYQSKEAEPRRGSVATAPSQAPSPSAVAPQPSATSVRSSAPTSSSAPRPRPPRPGLHIELK